MLYLLSNIVERSAEKYQNHEAFRCDGKSITYKDLNTKSNQLARLLQDIGINKGDRIGIYLHRCLETAIAVYGILKTGAVFVPLDPFSPPSRTIVLIKDCGIKVLISHDFLNRHLKALSIDDLQLSGLIGAKLASETNCYNWQDVFNYNPTVRKTPILGDDLAYIMYTSGTTGEPKGIIHTHYSGLAYAKLSADLYGLTRSDRLANHSPLHFDISTLGYFSGPLVGACTIIASDMHVKLPASLSTLIEEEEISIWYSVPIAIIQMMQFGALDKRNLSKLRWILFGGEPFPPKYIRQLMMELPYAKFSNVYGPAELNQCTYYNLTELPSGEEAIPIGGIWKDTELMIVDDSGNPCQLGQPGELYVRSSTMMKGYWNRPDLNEKVFYKKIEYPGINNKFFKTGDTVKMEEDGVLHFIGRKDRQIKSRGNRIELGEIETQILSLPQVKSAAVYAFKNEDDFYIIHSVISLQNDSDLNEEKVRQYLRSKLPNYAIPARIEIIDEVPRTSAGKINHKLLIQKARNAK